EAGILADKNKDSHLNEIKNLGIEPIDMVVVNLYPFKETISREDVTLEEAIENIDIGGPTMIRAAAKNYNSVAVIVSPDMYDEIIEHMKINDGSVSEELCFDLAKKVFEFTSDYDNAISDYLSGREKSSGSKLSLHFEKIQDLRYGENPHQKAAYYSEVGAPDTSLVNGKQLHGKELSFNNILDMNAAWSTVKEFEVPAVVIVKHTNPCGVGIGKDLIEAYDKAFASDSVSAFGGIVAINRPLDAILAKKLTGHFFEIIMAPAFPEEAIEILMGKKNLRIIHMGEKRAKNPFGEEYRRIDGGLLVQDWDISEDLRKDMKVATKRAPTDKEWEDLLFGWTVARHVRSNAIILTKNLATVGVGAGQMSRIDAFKIAAEKAGKKKKDSCLSSDAFFPFRDLVDAAAKEGITAIIQPGGSMRDQDSIEACNENGIAMVFTGKRHFLH
ncbi:MAG: bifunctional phosphoribosylaminoimidazolecarboxamide formyltransferase/IMP cyclohydrolase, partial [Actinomycetia bacterium]|nr:bifunctional phosphoribosylaminoimidazolecarboxamide formyltransferase/IMP cyclohydrolase [Actinomycetes bacterium]